MFKWLGQRFEKGKQETRQLWESEFNVVKEGLDEEQVVDFVNNLIARHKASQQASADSLRSLLKTAVADAEQMAASIRMKAQTEAEAEAAEIITQAKQEDQEIKRRAEVDAQKEAEDIISVADKKAEITEVEAKQQALLFLLRAREEIEKEVREEYQRAYDRLSSSLQNLVDEGQNIEMELKSKRARLGESKNFELKEHEAVLLKTSEEVMPPPETLPPEEEIEQPVQLQEEVSEEKTEQPVQLQEEATVSVPVEETVEELLVQHPPEEIPAREETSPTQLEPIDSQTIYAGEVELDIAIPVELKTVSKFYNHLQTIPDIKILRTTGSWDRGTTITVVADKPILLISEISKVPGVEVIAELLQQDSSVKGSARSRQRAGGKGVKKIKLTLKEA